MKGRNRNLRSRSRGYDRVGALLQRVLPPGAEEKLALPEVRREWEGIAGAVLGKKSLPLEIDKGVLLVSAETPAAAKALSMRGGTLAKKVSAATGLNIISLKVIVGNATAAPKKVTLSPRRGRITPPREEVEKALEEVRGKFSPEREHLARRLASLMAFYRTLFPER